MRAFGNFGSSSWAVGGLLVILSAGLTVLNTDFHEPPRGDGVGYAVLGASMAEGRGYREIDKPDQPRHAHFPPGYPAILAVVWLAAGRSEAVAHGVSIVATVLAVLLAWRWFRSLYRPGLAVGLALALAFNWTWARIGGEILSEPVYQFWQMLALVIAGELSRRGGMGKAIALGLVLGAATLTRYVGVCLALAIAVDLALQRRFREVFVSGLLAALVMLPWVVWMALTERSTHLELLPGGGGLVSTIAQQSLFYLRRIPDQIVGPFVEVGTIYRRSGPVVVAVHVWAVLATGLVLAGWLRCLRVGRLVGPRRLDGASKARFSHPSRRRIVSLWGFLTLALLLIWPFTEAGRFLVPLVPALVVGAVEGVTGVLARVKLRRRARRWAVAAVVAVSMPYSAYAVLSHRAEIARQGYEPFDEACRWLSGSGRAFGLVLTKHPAEVYWQTGRQGYTPQKVKFEDPTVLDRLGIAYVLVEPGPSTDPLRRFVEANAADSSRVKTTGNRPEFRVYAVGSSP